MKVPESQMSNNPYDGRVLAIIPCDTDRQVDQKLNACLSGRRDWAADPEPRISAIERLAEILDGRREELAMLATNEMGKPIRESRAEVEKCAALCRHYASRGKAYLEDRLLEDGGSGRDRIATRPIGTVLGIMPWNYPYWQAFRFIVPTMLCGNAVLLKHAGNVPQCALAIGEVMRDCGVGERIFNVLVIPHDRVRAIIEDSRVNGVSLTGSESAGAAVAKVAGANLKPLVLELGGSDPFIVLDDADLDHAVEVAVRARFQNAGQSCIAAKRFLLHDAIADDFVSRFVARVENLVVGDPSSDETQIGPLAKPKAVKDVLVAVREADRLGASVLVQGEAIGTGNLVSPFVVDRLTADMALSRDEIFGPVAAFRRFSDEYEAVEIANETRFGLGASVWCADEDRALALAKRLQCGMVFVNDMVASDPCLPFGGVKSSGYGRELGREGVLSFANRQSIRLPKRG